jgi:DNA-binding NtrC family response regulator
VAVEDAPGAAAAIAHHGGDSALDFLQSRAVKSAAASAEHWPDAALLIVDDEPGMRNFLAKTLAPRAGQVLEAGSAEQAEELLQRHRFDVVILDIALPGKSGIELLEQLREQGNPCQVVLITAFADLDTAIAALRAGASDMLLKPFRVAQVLAAFKKAMERATLERENWVLRRALQRRTPTADALVGSSIVVKGVQAALERVSAVDSTVLLTGESGTGKELAALALHRMSPRAKAPFVPVNCATMAPAQLEAELLGDGRGARARDGLFVYAQGGTLFFDAIDELPLPLQALLVRALDHPRIRPVGSRQEIAVNVRLVAATKQPLLPLVQAGSFRDDLYYRLQVVELKLPPLRAHKEDIPELVAHFVERLAPQLGVSPIEVTADEMRYLQQYHWPGNVRELRNLIERSLIVGALNVSALYQALPKATPAAVTGPTDLHVLEKRHILAVLDSVAGDKTRAAQLLGISRRTLERRCAEWAESA